MGVWITARAEDFEPGWATGLGDVAYRVEQEEVGGAIEHRFFYAGQHFATLIDDGGTYALRPHPGCDVNGWGSTWYAQPFLPGAILQHTTIEPPSVDASSIHVKAEGMVSQGTTGMYGTWESVMDYAYRLTDKMVTGTGVYTITLEGLLSESTGDLNLYKIASNYLDDVPLLSGGIGDTGDMTQADVMGDGINFDWVPPNQPAHFPSDESDILSINVAGQYNNVDTAAMGYALIAAAFKPSLKVVLISLDENAGIRFGGFYNLAERQTFWSDNVGITPIIAKTSTKTAFTFEVLFESEAIETCIYVPLVTR